MAKQQRGLPGSQQCPSLKGPAEPWKPLPNPTPPPSVSLLLQNVCFPKERCSFLLVQGHHFPLVQGQCLGHRLALPIIVFFCLKTKPNKTNPKPGPRLAGQPGPLRTPQLASTVGSTQNHPLLPTTAQGLHPTAQTQIANGRSLWPKLLRLPAPESSPECACLV